MSDPASVEALKIAWQMDEWWPCPRCGCTDFTMVKWHEYGLTWAFSDDLPDGSVPMFRKHFEYTVSFECTKCGAAGREVMAKGGLR